MCARAKKEEEHNKMKHKQCGLTLFSLRIIGATGPNPNHSFELKLEHEKTKKKQKKKKGKSQCTVDYVYDSDLVMKI